MAENRTPGEVSTPERGAAWFSRITFHSLLAGLCPLIPVPFLDDRALAWVRRRQVEEALRARGLSPSPSQVAVLTGEGEGDAGGGCLRIAFVWPLVKLSLYLVKKLFRKVVFFLLLNDCAESFSVTFHEAYLLHHALVHGPLDEAALASSSPRLTQVRHAMRQACREVDPRPVHQLVRRTFRGSRQAVLEASRLLGTMLRFLVRPLRRGAAVATAEPQQELPEQEPQLAGVLDRLTAALWHQDGYRRHLTRRFEAALATAEEAAPVPPSPSPPGGSESQRSA